MSLSSETPSLLSAEAHLRMLVDNFYTSKNADIEGIPAAAQSHRVIRNPLPIPGELFGDTPPGFLPIEHAPSTVKKIEQRVVATQTISPDQEVEEIRAAQASLSEQSFGRVPVVGALVLVNMVNYLTRDTTANPPVSRSAGSVITQTHLTIVRDMVNFDDAEYRVFGNIVRQVTPALGTSEPIEELMGSTPYFNGQLTVVNRYLIDTLVNAHSKGVNALTPENFA
jgi:hypothetical protein